MTRNLELLLYSAPLRHIAVKVVHGGRRLAECGFMSTGFPTSTDSAQHI